MDGKPMPESITKGQPIAQLQGKQLKCFGPQLEFKKWGKSGQYFSSAFPKIGEIADDMRIRSMTTEQINHDPAHIHEHGYPDFRASKYGILGALRIGSRD